MAKVITDKNKINELLTRGVEEIIIREELEKKLLSSRQLRIKLGIDPTSPNIHLGRAIPLLKLRDFQELGHKIVFIVGDATGVIGDTSDKESERPMLSREKVKDNMKSYVKQVGKILDLKKCEIRHNSEWLNKLGYNEIGDHADQFSLAEFIARENISKRLKSGSRISLREILYPLMQGYDSVAIKADVEIGGRDQRFNLLAGRTLQEYFHQPPQDLIAGPLLEGTDGRKMSSSWGNTINLLDAPDEMFGKIMTIPDNLILKYLTLATRLPIAEIIKLEKDMAAGGNPRDSKMILAREIVRMYHNERPARDAEDNFVRLFQKKEAPTEMPIFHLDKKHLKDGKVNVAELFSLSGLVSSKSEARRLIGEKGISIDGNIIDSAEYEVVVKDGMVLKKGKRFFIKLKI